VSRADVGGKLDLGTAVSRWSTNRLARLVALVSETFDTIIVSVRIFTVSTNDDPDARKASEACSTAASRTST